MAMTGVWLEIDEHRDAQAWQEAVDKLESVEGEVVLDFTSVVRIDVSALTRMEKFAVMADRKGVKVVLGGVSIGVYKVLKLAKLASRFSFAA